MTVVMATTETCRNMDRSRENFRVKCIWCMLLEVFRQITMYRCVTLEQHRASTHRAETTISLVIMNI